MVKQNLKFRFLMWWVDRQDLTKRQKKPPKNNLTNMNWGQSYNNKILNAKKNPKREQTVFFFNIFPFDLKSVDIYTVQTDHLFWKSFNMTEILLYEDEYFVKCGPGWRLNIPSFGDPKLNKIIYISFIFLTFFLQQEQIFWLNKIKSYNYFWFAMFKLNWNDKRYTLILDFCRHLLSAFLSYFESKLCN